MCTSSSPILSVSVTGFEQAILNLTEAEISNSSVKVVYRLSDSGVFSIDRAFFALPERTQTASVAGELRVSLRLAR
jgi:hypothetical protein